MMLLVTAGLKAQYGNIGYFNQANRLFDQRNYFEAAQAYEKYLQAEKKSRSRGTAFSVEKKIKGKSNLNPHQEAVYHLAESYRLCHDYTQAEKWYKQASGFSAEAYPACLYWYGVTLRTNKKYEEAFNALTKFVQTYKDLDPNLMNADRELDDLKFIQAQSNKGRQDQFILELQKSSTRTSQYAMAVRHDDTLVFTGVHSNPPQSKKDKETFSNDLYETVAGEDAISTAEMLTIDVGEDFHQGMANFTSDGKKMFFTRWSTVNGMTKSAIYVSELKDSGWSLAEKLDEPINIPGYNNAQPFITPDGKFLLFASDRPGGFGKFDLWFAALDEHFQVLSVSNMGSTINTSQDEESPFYHEQSRTLVFSSNGRVGMGGFDIFYSNNDYSFSHWTQPVNPGSPINSTKDDIYFVSTDKDNIWNTGWISSDRASDCCLALFSVKDNTERFVSGRVIDCQTSEHLSGAELTITDPVHKNKVLFKVPTDSLGQYHFGVRNVSRFRILAQKQGYKAQENVYRMHFEAGMDTVKNDPLCLAAIKETASDIAVKGILNTLSRETNLGNFAYKKATLTSTTNSNLDSLANLMKAHPSIVVQIGGYTDGIGGEAYNIKLAQARVNTCLKYLIKKGIDPARLKGKSFGKCCPIAPETINGKDNPAGRAKNRRVEFSLLVGEDGTGEGARDPRQ